MFRWAEYIEDHPQEVLDPQLNSVVNGQVESSQAVDLSTGDREGMRELADETLRAESERYVNE